MTILKNYATKSCQTRSSTPTISNCTSSSMWVGWSGFEIYLNFPKCDLAGATINSAYLYIKHNSQGPITVRASRLIEEWDYAPTWNNNPDHTDTNSFTQGFSWYTWNRFTITAMLRDMLEDVEEGVKLRYHSGQTNSLFYVEGNVPYMLIDYTMPDPVIDQNFGTEGIFTKPIQHLDGIYTK